jgi:hypothetical protein
VRRGVIPYSPLAGGWLSGRYSKDAENAGPVSSVIRLANRFDLSLPENQRKLDAVQKLSELADEAGITLIELALAFVLRHPAITAAIIGPRTMEHLESQVTAADVTLSDDVLDRIDAIVAPGTTINVADNGWTQVAIGETRLLCLCSPAGQEEFFKEVGVSVAYRTEAPPALDDAATRAFVAKAIALAPKYRTEVLLGESKPRSGKTDRDNGEPATARRP